MSNKSFKGFKSICANCGEEKQFHFWAPPLGCPSRKASKFKRLYRKIAYNIIVIDKKDRQPYRIVGRSPVGNKIILTDEKQTHMVSYYKLRKHYV